MLYTYTYCHGRSSPSSPPTLPTHRTNNPTQYPGLVNRPCSQKRNRDGERDRGQDHSNGQNSDRCRPSSAWECQHRPEISQLRQSHEMCSGSKAGSYLSLIDSCITQLKAQGPSRTCNQSKEEVSSDRRLPSGGLVRTLKAPNPTTPHLSPV